MATALVFSAGGLYAAWEVGVWKALREKVRPDMVVGASAGAWNGWAIAGGSSAEELAEEWLDPLTAKIMQVGVHRSGVLRPEALHAKARELFDRFKPRLPFALTVVEVPRLRVEVVRDREICWEHLAATCAIPLGFPPVSIGGKQYVDGGLMGALPVWVAEAMGASRAIALNVLTTFPFRALRTIFRVRQPRGDFPVVLIEPSTRLGSLSEAVCWSADRIKRWIEQGEQDGYRALSSITM
jgi:NTE family protein